MREAWNPHLEIPKPTHTAVTELLDAGGQVDVDVVDLFKRQTDEPFAHVCRIPTMFRGIRCDTAIWHYCRLEFFWGNVSANFHNCRKYDCKNFQCLYKDYMTIIVVVNFYNNFSITRIFPVKFSGIIINIFQRKTTAVCSRSYALLLSRVPERFRVDVSAVESWVDLKLGDESSYPRLDEALPADNTNRVTMTVLTTIHCGTKLITISESSPHPPPWPSALRSVWNRETLCTPQRQRERRNTHYITVGTYVYMRQGNYCRISLVATEMLAFSWKSSRNKNDSRSEERRVGKECRSRWSPYH